MSLNSLIPNIDTTLDSGELAWKSILSRGSVMFPPTSGNFYSSSILRKVGEIPEDEYKIRADVYLHHTLPFEGSVVVINKILGLYRVHGKNSWFVAKKSKFASFSQYFNRNLVSENLARREQKIDLLLKGAIIKKCQIGSRGRTSEVALKVEKYIKYKMSLMHENSSSNSLFRIIYCL